MKIPDFRKQIVPSLGKVEERDCYLMKEVDGEQVRIEKRWIIDDFRYNEKKMPNYLGLNGFTKWEIIGEFIEMPETIFKKFYHIPFENIELLMEEFEKYGWNNKKHEKGLIETIKSKIFTAKYKTPQLYEAK